MKKKLKVEKAFVGKMMRAAPAQARRVIPVKQPRPIPVKQPRPGVIPGVQPLPAAPGPLGGGIRPGVQPLPVASGSGPFGGSVTQPAVVGEPPQSIGSMLRAATIPGNQAPMQQPASVGGLAEYALRQQPAPGGMAQPVPAGLAEMLPAYQPSKFQQPGMAQPLPTAPNFGGPAPQGGDRFVNMFRQQPAPMQQAPLQQQVAPVQPVPAMKKGGIVRGGRAEIKGTRPAKLS